jgi:hypothetical protein
MGLMGLGMILPLVRNSVLADEVTYAKALVDYSCRDEQTGEEYEEWHFVITQVVSEAQAPESILVSWNNGSTEAVPLDKFTGATAHYATTSHLDEVVLAAEATLYDGWDGEFNLSHGPCLVPSPTPTLTPTPEPTAIPTVTPSVTPTPTDTVFDWSGDLGPEETTCQTEPGWLTVYGSIDVTPDDAHWFLETDWYIPVPSPILNCPVGSENCNESHYTLEPMVGDTTFSITGWWPGSAPQNETVEIHFGANVHDADGYIVHDGIGKDIYRTYYTECEPTPTVTPTLTPTPSPTLTPTPTVTPTVTPTPTPTETESPTPTPTVTDQPTPTPTCSIDICLKCDGEGECEVIIGKTPTPTPTQTPEVSPTPEETVTPVPTPSPTPGRGGPTDDESTDFEVNGPDCYTNHFTAKMTLKNNGQGLKDKTVRFQYLDQVFHAVTNDEGSATANFTFAGNGEVKAESDGYPTQTKDINAPENCGEVLGETTGDILGYADTGSAWLNVLFLVSLITSGYGAVGMVAYAKKTR